MKKIWMLVCLACVGAASAQADDDRPIRPEQLPAEGRAFIAKHFPGLKVSYAKEETDWFDRNYDVIFVDGSKVEFDKRGRWKKVDCERGRIPETVIPTAIREQVKRHHGDRPVVEIERDDKGWEVKLDTGLELKFDSRFRLVDMDH